MRSDFLGRSALALVLSVGVVACGDDDPTDPGNEGDELTEAEAEVMIDALVQAGGFALGTFGTQATDGPAPVEFGPVTFEETVPCPQGGTVTIDGSYSGDIDDETGLGTLDYQFVQTHDECMASAASDNSTWTFDGSPNITIDFGWTLGETSFEFGGVQSGAVAFQGADKAGTCVIDLTYDISGSQDGSSFSGSVSGTVCGISVSETVSFSD